MSGRFHRAVARRTQGSSYFPVKNSISETSSEIEGTNDERVESR